MGGPALWSRLIYMRPQPRLQHCALRLPIQRPASRFHKLRLLVLPCPQLGRPYPRSTSQRKARPEFARLEAQYLATQHAAGFNRRSWRNAGGMAFQAPGPWPAPPGMIPTAPLTAFYPQQVLQHAPPCANTPPPTTSQAVNVTAALAELLDDTPKVSPCGDRSSWLNHIARTLMPEEGHLK